MEMLNQVFNCYEYDLLPLRQLFSRRAIQCWLSRWREIALYIMLARDKYVFGKIQLKKYLKPYRK